MHVSAVPRIVLGGSLDLFAALSEPGGIQKQMEEFNIFLQDPRPIEEKAAGVTGVCVVACALLRLSMLYSAI